MIVPDSIGGEAGDRPRASIAQMVAVGKELTVPNGHRRREWRQRQRSRGSNVRSCVVLPQTATGRQARRRRDGKLGDGAGSSGTSSDGDQRAPGDGEGDFRVKLQQHPWERTMKPATIPSSRPCDMASAGDAGAAAGGARQAASGCCMIAWSSRGRLGPPTIRGGGPLGTHQG